MIPYTILKPGSYPQDVVNDVSRKLFRGPTFEGRVANTVATANGAGPYCTFVPSMTRTRAGSRIQPSRKTLLGA